MCVCVCVIRYQRNACAVSPSPGSFHPLNQKHTWNCVRRLGVLSPRPMAAALTPDACAHSPTSALPRSRPSLDRTKGCLLYTILLLVLCGPDAQNRTPRPPGSQAAAYVDCYERTAKNHTQFSSNRCSIAAVLTLDLHKDIACSAAKQ